MAAETEDLEPGIGADRRRAAPRRRVDEKGTEGRPGDAPGERDHARGQAGCPQVGQDERPGTATEPRVAAVLPSDPSEEGDPLGRARHEQDVPAGPAIERGLVPAELVADDRTALGVLVDLETEDGRARRCLEDDDAIGIGLGQEIVGHDLGQPGLDERLAAVGAGLDEGAHGLADVEAVAELGAGPRAGERVVAETTTSAGGDAEGVRSTTAGGRWQDRAFEIARAIEEGKSFLCRLTAGVDEGRELGCGRDVGAVEDAQRGAIAVGQEAWIDDDPARWCGCGGERTDHGTVGSRPGSHIPAHETGGRDRGPETPTRIPHSCRLAVAEGMDG